MLTNKKSLHFLITPNYEATYDQRMVNGLAQGLQAIGHQAIALPAPISPLELLHQCKKIPIDIVIQVNRTRDKEISLPSSIRHISWYQDVFPKTLDGFAESFHKSDILYALGDPEVLGLNVQLPCYVGSLVTGVDPLVLNYKNRHILPSIETSLCGFIPPPLPKERSFLRYMLTGKPRWAYNIIKNTVQKTYRPLKGELDIHELVSAIDHNLMRYQKKQLATKKWFPTLPGIRKLQEQRASTKIKRLINSFTKEYPRLLDRIALIERILTVTNSLELYGPGWKQHRQFRPYAKGFINTQEGLLDIYCRSKINLANNTHGLGLHSRTLECMAVAGFILTHESPHDSKPGGMLTCFEPGVHFGVFTPDNLENEAMRWIKDDKQRIVAGLNAAEIIREQHGWHHRAMQICEDLQK